MARMPDTNIRHLRFQVSVEQEAAMFVPLLKHCSLLETSDLSYLCAPDFRQELTEVFLSGVCLHLKYWHHDIERLYFDREGDYPSLLEFVATIAVSYPAYKRILFRAHLSIGSRD
jgi:hypothetical protein